MTVLRDYAAGLTQPTLTQGSADHLGGGNEASPRYDEVVGPDGSLRAPWKRLAEIATQISPEDMHRVTEEIARFLEDDGVT